MDNTGIKPDNFFKTACYFEASLIIVALILGTFADINPFENIYFSEKSVMYGILGTLPLYLMFMTMEHMPSPSVQKIRHILIDTVGSSLHKKNWADLFILATIAGISEEVLFRGVIQPWMENSWGMMAGLLVSSVLFGLLHAVTPLYAILATSISIYLGLSLDYGGERNLLTPIVIHALYDFLAFIAIVKTYRATLPTNNNQ
jgi:membrane protease YdiL (CAAX protease family)